MPFISAPPQPHNVTKNNNKNKQIIEELHKQHAEEIREYKARILDLENQVATLTMGGLAIQVLHQWQQMTVNFSLCKQRRTQL